MVRSQSIAGMVGSGQGTLDARRTEIPRMAVTANGWPYVEPADKPLEYPALSQQLATKLDPYTPLLPALTTLTPASGWMDIGGGYGGLFVTKQGRIVVIDAVFKPLQE